MKTALSILVSTVALTCLAVGCAAPEDAPASNGGTDELNASGGYQPPKTCGDAKWNAAFKHYKRAVDLAKARIASPSPCAGDWYLFSIVEEAHAAADTCGDFSSIVADSPWAAPVRQVMSETLDLDVITKKVSTADWSGLDGALAGGVTFYDPDGGVLGNRAELTLGAQGTGAELREHGFTAAGEVETKEKVGHYKIGQRQPDGSIPIVLELSAPGGAPEIKVLTLTPELQIKVDGRSFWTTPSECSA